MVAESSCTVHRFRAPKADHASTSGATGAALVVVRAMSALVEQIPGPEHPHRGAPPRVLDAFCSTAQGLGLSRKWRPPGSPHSHRDEMYAKIDLSALREVADFDLGTGMRVGEVIKAYVALKTSLGMSFESPRRLSSSPGNRKPADRRSPS